MSGLQRIDRLTAPPVVGKFYLVPTVSAEWNGTHGAWPVIGPMHTDKEFFEFEAEHYHIDGRFLTSRQWSFAEEHHWTSEAAIQSAPLHSYNGAPELPKPAWLKKRCSRDSLDYKHGHQKAIIALRSHFAGAQCAHGKAGWICPHRKAPLGSVVAVDGIITCPLHGLQINAETGRVVAPTHPTDNASADLSEEVKL